MLPHKAEKQQFIPDEEQWKQILKEVHLSNVPIQILRKNRGIVQLYANHVPTQLYVKHSYNALKRSLQSYVEEFEVICHNKLDKNMKKLNILEQHQNVIKLGLQQITEQLAFLNLRPISEVMHLLNTLVFRVTMNFINFSKSVKKNNFYSFERKRQSKESLENLCLDCKTNRQQGLLKDLKRKLNLNKTQLLTVQESDTQNNQDPSIKKSARQKQSDIINQFARVKHQTRQNLRLQDERQSAWTENKPSKQNCPSKSNAMADEILMNEKEIYIKQVNDILNGRQVKEASNTNTYSYLINELMEFPHLDKLHQETYAKEAEKIVEKIQGELLQNFMATLSEPLKLVLRKVFRKKYMMNLSSESNIDKIAIPIQKISVEVQTPLLQFEQKIKFLQKELQKKEVELNHVKENKKSLQKKYFDKYEEQRENQRQLHQNLLTIKDLKQQIQQIKQQKQNLKQKSQRQLSSKIQTMKRIESGHLQTLSEINTLNQKKYHQYRQRMNQDVQNKIRKLKQEAQQQINSIRYETSINLNIRPSVSIGNSHNTILARENKIELSIKKISENSNNFYKNNHGDHPQIYEKNDVMPLNQSKNHHAFTTIGLVKDKITQDSLQIENNDDQIPFFDKTSSIKLTEDKICQKIFFSSIRDSKKQESQRIICQSKGDTNDSKRMEHIEMKSKDCSLKSIDMMIKHHQNKNHQSYKNFKQNKNIFEQTYLKWSEENQKSQKFNEIDECPSKSLYQSKVKIINQFQMQGQQERLGIQTEKSSPNKKFSARKFRKMHKQVQFSFKKKNNQTESEINFKSETSQDNSYNFIERDGQKKNMNSGKKENNQNQNSLVQNENEKQKLKSTLKLKYITLEDQSSRKNSKETKVRIIHKKSFKSAEKSNQKKKYIDQSNQAIGENSNYGKSIQPLSNLKEQQKKVEESEIWIPQFKKRDYDIEVIKSLIQREFQYFKLTGIIEKIYDLEVIEKKNINERILSVAKKVTNFTDKKDESQKSKSNLQKSQKTLRRILQRSMNRLDLSNEQKIEEFSKNQVEEIVEDFNNQICKIQTFSKPTVEDLSLFGGIENAQRMEINNFDEGNSTLFVKNTTNQGEELRLIEYFQKLFDLSPEKYKMYTNFLKYPTSYLNGNLYKLVKQSSNALLDSRDDFKKDMSLLSSSIKKILKFHEKQHQNKCIHLQKFLKKIGYFRYMRSLSS